MSDVVLVLDSHKDRQVYPVQDAVLVLDSHKDAETGSLPCARCSPGAGQSQRQKAYPVQDVVLVLDSHKDAETESLPCARCNPGVGQSQLACSRQESPPPAPPSHHLGFPG